MSEGLENWKKAKTIFEGQTKSPKPKIFKKNSADIDHME